MIEGFIAPQGLLDLVHNTVPWLELPPAEGRAPHEVVAGPRGFLAVLAASGFHTPTDEHDDAVTLDYFALCLAAHHSTVASFVPTDVDSKIRGLLWRRVRDVAQLERMWDVTQRFCAWDVESVSRRTVHCADRGVVSGHDGERLSVMTGALGRALGLEAEALAATIGATIEAELEREAEAFLTAMGNRDREIDALWLAAILTHNVGDLDQGLSFWPRTGVHAERARPLARLAHENTTPYNGAFARAARLYKLAMAPEGHRNYPLRGVRVLRESADYLLPMAPFLDDWGERLGRDARLGDEDLAALLEALVTGSRKLAGQRGYYRAIAGLVLGTSGTRLESAVAAMPASVRAEWRSSELRRQVAVPRLSFESMMRKMVRSVL